MSMPFAVEKFEGYTFGATVTGVSAQEALADPAIMDKLREAFNTHGFLLLPAQHMTPAEELALAKAFPHDADAPIEERAGPYSEAFRQWKLIDHPEIQVQGWGKVEDHFGVNGTMSPKVETREWHSDGLHELATPPVLTSVYAVSVPPEGGETLFADGNLAWDALDREEQAKLHDKRGTYNRPAQRMNKAGTRPELGELNVKNGPTRAFDDSQYETAVQQPLFRVHPVTKRVALCVAPMFLREVDGMSWEESAQLVERLLESALRPDNVYGHKFSVGDLVLWDNRRLLHSAVPTPMGKDGKGPQGLRLLHRIRMSSKEVLEAPPTPCKKQRS